MEETTPADTAFQSCQPRMISKQPKEPEGGQLQKESVTDNTSLYSNTRLLQFANPQPTKHFREVDTNLATVQTLFSKKLLYVSLVLISLTGLVF